MFSVLILITTRNWCTCFSSDRLRFHSASINDLIDIEIQKLKGIENQKIWPASIMLYTVYKNACTKEDQGISMYTLNFFFKLKNQTIGDNKTFFGQRKIIKIKWISKIFFMYRRTLSINYSFKWNMRKYEKHTVCMTHQ